MQRRLVEQPPASEATGPRGLSVVVGEPAVDPGVSSEDDLLDEDEGSEEDDEPTHPADAARLASFGLVGPCRWSR